MSLLSLLLYGFYIISSYSYFMSKSYFKSKSLYVYHIEHDKNNLKHIIPINNLTTNYDVMKYLKHLKPSNHSNNRGNDDRFNNDYNETMVLEIYKNYEKKKLLHMLSSNDISHVKKLELIMLNQYLFSIDGLVDSIKKGGIFYDYNFEINDDVDNINDI